MTEQKKKIEFRFFGIDYWNRPVFINDGGTLIGSVEVLFPDKDLAPNNTPEEITKYFLENKNKLVLFGNNIEDDPLGTSINPDKYTLVW